MFININLFFACLDWADLPKHLLELVVDKLESSTDYLHFGAVCISWLSILQNNQSRLDTIFCHQAPLLLIPDEHEHKWRVYDVTKDKFLKSKLLVPYPNCLCGSSEGWLVGVNKDSTVTLHKPGFVVTNSSVELPCIFPYGIVDYHSDFEDFVDLTDVADYNIEKAILNYDQRAKLNQLTVVAIFSEFSELAFIRHGKDATWSKIDASYNNEQPMVVDILLYNNQFYALKYCGGLVSFNITDSGVSTVKWLAPPKEDPLYDHKKYLVKSYGGELLLVERYIITWPGGRVARETKSFKVFRFDFDGKKWIELTSLGDTALLLGDNSSISVLAYNFPGCQSNCIYFTHDRYEIENRENTIIRDMGVYHMEDKSFKRHYTIDPTTLITSRRRLPIWFTPSILV